MKLLSAGYVRADVRRAAHLPILALLAAFTTFAPAGVAQSGPSVVQSDEPKATDTKPDFSAYLAIQLSSITTATDANDIQTALRNLLPRTRVYYVPSQAMLTLHGSAYDIKLAEKIVADLDRPKKTYRLTYTIRDVDGGKTLGTQHFSVVLAAGGKTSLKQGMRVPLVTGTSEYDKSGKDSQVQYIDIGLNLEASLEGYQDGVRLKTEVEQSGVADEKSGLGAQDPVIRQTTLEATSSLTEGKPVVLGTMDKLGEASGGSHKQEIEVVSEVVR
jgi:type II secretory pathway component GspD/PulD (secretin)